MTSHVIAQFLGNVLSAAAPLVLAALGGVFSWRVGIFHLGLEGLILIGAFGAVAGELQTHSVVLGILTGLVFALVMSVVFWWVIDVLRADPVVAGLGLSFLGLGLTSYLLSAMFGATGSIPSTGRLWRPVNNADTLPLSIVNHLSVLVWATPAVVAVVWLALRRTRWGILLGAIGDDPFSARSAGVNVRRYRLTAVCLTGLLCALAGAEMALGTLGSFTEDMAQGRGYIAFTAVVFGGGGPIGATVASLVFAGAQAIGIQSSLKSSHSPIPTELVQAIPFLLTIAAAWLASMSRRRRGAYAAVPAEARAR